MIEKLYELYNTKDIDGLMALYSPDAEVSSVIFPSARGLDEIRRLFERDFRAFPDTKVTILKLLSDESMAMAEWTATGTNSGPMIMPDGKIIPPTGRTFTVRGMEAFEFKGDRITKDRLYYQLLEILKQLGLLSDFMKQLGLLYEMR